MKTKIIFYILILLSVNIIYAQNKKQMKKQEKTYLPPVTPEFETFDTVRFNRIKVKNYLDTVEKLPDGTVIIMGMYGVVSFYGEIPPSSRFAIIKNYYPNGNIQSKGLGFNYDRFAKGVWYYYDEAGNLEKTTDYDKPFKFTFEQVLKFCEREGIFFKKGYLGWDGKERPSIRRTYTPEQDICYWEIRWFNQKKGKIEYIYLDGVTGKEISREYMDLFY
jgi:antitoxin component YwqK of YwqJK toxin-antitoxin module